MRFYELSKKIEAVESDTDNLYERALDLKYKAENVWPFDFKGYDIADAIKALNRDVGTTSVTVGYVSSTIDSMIAANHRITPQQVSEIERDQSSLLKTLSTVENTCKSAHTALLNNNIWASLQDIWDQFSHGISRVSMQIMNWGIKNLVAPLLPGVSNQGLIEGASSFFKNFFN